MKKKDMYINYHHSYSKRGRRSGNRIFKIIFILLLLIAIGCLCYYGIIWRINQNLNINNNGDNNNYITSDVDQEIDADVNTDLDLDLHQDEEHGEGAGLDNQEEDNGQVNDPNNLPDDEQGQEVGVADNRSPVVAKGIYVTASAMVNRRDEIIDIADTTEINALVIDVKDDNGRITYNMNSELVQEIGAATNTISDMENLIYTLKDKGIYTIARIVAFKDPYLASQKQEWAIKKMDGSLYQDNNNQYWINPYKREVWDYLIEVATEAAKIGFDEIQFDYIRFSTGGGIENADYGEDAVDISKEDIITEFTKQAYEKLKPLGVFVSADVYGTIISSQIDAALIGQNYVEMSKYLDYICPMIYPSHFGEGNYGIEYPDLQPQDIVRKVLVASKEKLDTIPEEEHRAIVRPWLQDFTASWISNYQVYGGKQVREQIEGVYAAGYEEWILWNSTGRYSIDGLLEE
jgi:hypothetical protein